MSGQIAPTAATPQIDWLRECLGLLRLPTAHWLLTAASPNIHLSAVNRAWRRPAHPPTAAVGPSNSIAAQSGEVGPKFPALIGPKGVRQLGRPIVDPINASAAAQAQLCVQKGQTGSVDCRANGIDVQGWQCPTVPIATRIPLASSRQFQLAQNVSSSHWRVVLPMLLLQLRRTIKW